MAYNMTIIYVPDPGETAKFWARAFGFTIHTILEDNSYADLEPQTKGGISIGFVNSFDFEDMYHYKFEDASTYQIPRTQLMLHSQNVDSDFKKAITNGAQEILPPHKTDWSLRVAYVEDPNGTVVILSGPMNPDLMKRKVAYINPNSKSMMS